MQYYIYAAISNVNDIILVFSFLTFQLL